MGRFIDSDTRNYQACVWLTKEATHAAAEKVRDLLHALTLGRKIEYIEGDWERPGRPYAPHNKWAVKIDEFWVFGRTKEEAECKMLGMVLTDGSIGFPLFRRCRAKGGE